MDSPFTPSTSTERIRLTITVTPEVHAAFTKLSTASGMSLGRAMGEWLQDTLDAVEFTAEKVVQARSAPKLVMQEMHAYALGLVDETNAVMDKMRKEGAAARKGGGSPHPSARARLSPPSSNTGGKVPRTRGKMQGGSKS